MSTTSHHPSTPPTHRPLPLAPIDPKYVEQTALWLPSHLSTPRGSSIRIQHLTSTNSLGSGGVSMTMGGTVTSPVRFSSNLEECAHFHYEHCGGMKRLHLLPSPKQPHRLDGDNTPCTFSIRVTTDDENFTIHRTHKNLQSLDAQLHRCVWSRTFSQLEEVKGECDGTCPTHTLPPYLSRLSSLPTDKITCGTVLGWFELDNRSRHIIKTDAINTPAVAAACAVKRYVAEAGDEISFEIGDILSLIDLPPPTESSWFRGKNNNFKVGFFPRDCVQLISDDKHIPSSPRQPVLRKHGKLISFFRSFILSRPPRRELKQSGILRERVFGCDLGELVNGGEDEVPPVVSSCTTFIESHGGLLLDGIYRLSGVTSNIQKLRTAFDSGDSSPLTSPSIRQDIHAVCSVLKMYFRELPNPLCTYQMYEEFVSVVKETDEEERLKKMRGVVGGLPPPHARTLSFLMNHLSLVCSHSAQTGMTARNMAIVWAPNLIRCRELEVGGGVEALKGIGIQAVVTEYLITHADLIFNNAKTKQSPQQQQQQTYISVGSSSPPCQYHTVINLPTRKNNKKWKNIFTRNRSFEKRKHLTPADIMVIPRSMPQAGPQGMQTDWGGRVLRGVKSVEDVAKQQGVDEMEEIEEEKETADIHVSMETEETRNLAKTHNRSISHDSYFGEFRSQSQVYKTLQEETTPSPPVTPPPSASSNVAMPTSISSNVAMPTSTSYENAIMLSSRRRDSEVQTSQLKLSDVGVSTDEDFCLQKSTVDTSTSIEELKDESSSEDEDDKCLTTNVVYSELVDAEEEENIFLFICPLYEAGITEVNSEMVSEIKHDEITQEPPPHHYENFTPPPPVNQKPTPPPRHHHHHNIYENDTNIIQQTPKPKAKEPLPSGCINEDISSSHYENIVYEDIYEENSFKYETVGDDNNQTTVEQNMLDDDYYNYEPIRFENNHHYSADESSDDENSKTEDVCCFLEEDKQTSVSLDKHSKDPDDDKTELLTSPLSSDIDFIDDQQSPLIGNSLIEEKESIHLHDNNITELKSLGRSNSAPLETKLTPVVFPDRLSSEPSLLLLSKNEENKTSSSSWKQTERYRKNSVKELLERFEKNVDKHRFSMGDILTEEGSSKSIMTRSDTFPELRDAAKPIPITMTTTTTPIDLTDPKRRERIEKYKEERRAFLRRKIEVSNHDDDGSAIMSSNSEVSSSKETSSSPLRKRTLSPGENISSKSVKKMEDGSNHGDDSVNKTHWTMSTTTMKSTEVKLDNMKPVFRREVTSRSVELRTNSKKIADMKAFFEGKKV